MIIISNVGGGCKLSGKRPVTENLLQVLNSKSQSVVLHVTAGPFWEIG